jgi:hypothetical protein
MAVQKISVKEVHALAGVFVPPAPRSENPLLVIVTHSRTSSQPEGCGALGHLNPHHAGHGVAEIFEGLRLHGIDAEAYFGMGEKKLAEAVKAVGFEADANERARRLFGEAKAHGVPVVGANFGHEDGSITIVGTSGLEQLEEGQPIDLFGAVCADARVPSEVLACAARCALENRQACSFPELVARDAAVQKPREAVVYGRGTLVPDTKSGGAFKVVVDPEKGADLASKLSLAYAIASFGPQGKGPRSLVRIRLHQVGETARSDLARHLSGAKGIKIL